MNKYQKAFQALPHTYRIDPGQLKNRKEKRPLQPLRTVFAALLVFFLSFTAIYASDEDFRTDFGFWIRGKRTTAELKQIDACHYEVIVHLPDGEIVVHSIQSEEPLDPDVIIQSYQNMPEVAENSSGKVLFYRQNKVRDITDRFKPLNRKTVFNDGAGKEIPGVIKDYCYYCFDKTYYTILHIAADDGSFDRYTMTSSGPEPSASEDIPTYAEYTGKAQYYDEPTYVRSGDKEYICYHDTKLDLADIMHEWNIVEDADGYHFVYESYGYVKIDNLYISMILEDTVDPQGSTADFFCIYDENGYAPLRTNSGVQAPLPDGPIIEYPPVN